VEENELHACRSVSALIVRLGRSSAESEGLLSLGPGYRVYFGKDGARIVILLGGGTKQRQGNDILLALDRWKDYKSMLIEHELD
jgi:putative addiction module killer protein